MMAVNERVAEPRPPGPWVNPVRCLCCGAEYADHVMQFLPALDFADAAAQLRSHNGGWHEGGGYRSRGPVLWLMRVQRLTDWYLFHDQCGQFWPDRCGELVFDDDDPEEEFAEYLDQEDDDGWLYEDDLPF